MNESLRNTHAACSWSTLAAAVHIPAIFISSYSAYPDFPTSYGRNKAAAEVAFRMSGQTIVRPALVLGPGGLFADIIRRSLHSRVLPLPNGGRDSIEYVHVEDCVLGIIKLAEQSIKGEHNFSGGSIPLMSVVRLVTAAAGSKPPFTIPIPTDLLIAATLPLSILAPIRKLRRNLLGYRENSRRRRTSDLLALNGSVTSAHASISSAVHHWRTVVQPH